MQRGFWGLGLIFSLGGLGVQTFAASGGLGLLVPGPTGVQPDTVYRSEVLSTVTLVGEGTLRDRIHLPDAVGAQLFVGKKSSYNR